MNGSFERPDVLVLGGGGVLGEAWMSALLAGLEEAAGFDPRGCEAFVGTSAGSIVAAALAAGIDPRTRVGELPEQPPAPEPGSGRSRTSAGPSTAGVATGTAGSRSPRSTSRAAGG